MNKFSIIEVTNFDWSTIVTNCKEFDFYHTLSYNQLEKKNRPVLFLYEFGKDFIAIPLIIRKIEKSDYFDITSVYGYAGPISSLLFNEIDESVIKKFQNELINFFKNNNIISVFSRLHPIIQNEKFFINFGLVEHINKTVVIDLKVTLEEQKKQYRKSNKSELNQLRRKGFEVVEATTIDEIDKFVSIYHETMQRVDANSNYFFDYKYFYSFLKNPCFKSKLLLAKFNGEVSAGAIFTITNKIMQYHLAGTTEKYIKETPMKLILDEARLLANQLNLDYLHLGGGVGGSDEDSLFRFKSGFSDKRGFYNIWKMVVDDEKYEKLVNELNVDTNSDFFPLYRV
ncbi:GNAT family N-acetyltransferase [Flavobacterium sp.]|jgi:hypothetical protein|uniref:GNAT family N-acetyltransferase n=1 Tax=Flavobacterium sp. TaxID=239 RepID=UPI0037C0330B